VVGDQGRTPRHPRISFAKSSSLSKSITATSIRRAVSSSGRALEVYLGDTGIYYRQLSGEGEPAVVTAGGPAEPPAAGTLLYTF
jgi:hypothetical protein